MESCSSWEKLNIKTRKPYTITKQRERWTEDEHNSFLEALKLYGRAWQRIEEHIGTKTAVQIRSHAQKFFTKLEKEAVAKGVPIGQALDLEIPPPRPKRKPNYPYPRNTHTREPEKPPTSVSSLQVPDLEIKPLPEKTSYTENLENEKPVPNETFNTVETGEQDGVVDGTHFAHENIVQGQYSDKPVSLINHIQGKQTYPRHVPVQVVDVHQDVRAKTSVPDPANLLVNIATASASSVQNVNSTLDNQENYKSFLDVSSTISSVLVSSLLQNPAAYAAASFAAKFYLPANTAEASSADSYSRDQLNPEATPSMAAIAAATVAAATAWWSAHGPLPVCTLFYPGGYFQTPMEENQVRVADTRREKAAPSEGVLQEEKTDTEEDLHDSNKTNVGKQIDRSSCGSNTSSSSEPVSEKHGKEAEETKGSDVKESIISPNETCKGVSEEASYSNPCHIFWKLETEMDRQRINKNSELDLNRMSQEPGESNGFVGEEGVLRMGLGSVKVNAHHMGFRPYKRCSVEAKESCKIVTGDEKSPKRMCLGTEASN
ncbi:putative transcription factor MYB-HB-like family [Helianthus annuus]|nr:putative transcription factor MYB-HB-like family [Helianthus annuus]